MLNNKDTAPAVLTPHNEFVDSMHGGLGSRMGMYIHSGGDSRYLRTHDLLRKDEWVDLDTRLVEIARQRLVGIADLQRFGLAFNVGGLGTTISQFEKLGDMTEADVDMSAASPGEEGRVPFELVSVPVPIIHKDFRLHLRHLLASRRVGASIDTTQAEIAARRVADKLEDILFNGAPSIVVNSAPLYGYTNFPDTNNYSGSNWATIDNIYNDILEMVQILEGDNFFGPYVLYVAKRQYGLLRKIYDATGESAMERVLRGITAIQEIRPADVLPNGRAVLVHMSRDVVDLAVAQDLTTVQWESQGGMEVHFKVMTALAPRIKSDSKGQCGVVHATGLGT